MHQYIFPDTQISRWRKELFVSLTNKIILFKLKILQSDQKWPKKKNIWKNWYY